MSSLALSKTLAELDALNALSESLKQRIDKSVMEARVALEKMAVAMEDKGESESESDYKEPDELTALKELDIDSDEITRLKRMDSLATLLGNSHYLQDAFMRHILRSDIDINLIELLLPFIDPSDENNGAIINASSKGHLAIVERLLQDPRVDPTANDNEAIRYASKKWASCSC